MTKVPNHYDVLKVSRDSPTEVIRSAWEALASKHYPGKQRGSSVAGWSYVDILNKAHDVLTDPEKRVEYDLWLSQQEEAAEAEEKEKLLQVFLIPPPASINKNRPLPLIMTGGWKPIKVFSAFFLSVAGIFLLFWAITREDPQKSLVSKTFTSSPSNKSTSSAKQQPTALQLAEARAALAEESALEIRRYRQGQIEKRKLWLQKEKERLQHNAQIIQHDYQRLQRWVQQGGYQYQPQDRGEYQRQLQQHQQWQSQYQQDLQVYQQRLRENQQQIELLDK